MEKQLSYVSDILNEFYKIRDELLECYGIATVQEIFEELLKRNPEQSREELVVIINNCNFLN